MVFRLLFVCRDGSPSITDQYANLERMLREPLNSHGAYRTGRITNPRDFRACRFCIVSTRIEAERIHERVVNDTGAECWIYTTVTRVGQDHRGRRIVSSQEFPVAATFPVLRLEEKI